MEFWQFILQHVRLKRITWVIVTKHLWYILTAYKWLVENARTFRTNYTVVINLRHHNIFGVWILHDSMIIWRDVFHLLSILRPKRDWWNATRTAASFFWFLLTLWLRILWIFLHCLYPDAIIYLFGIEQRIRKVTLLWQIELDSLIHFILVV